MDAVDQLFAKIALKNKLVSEEQIKECAAKGGPLGKGLVEKGYLNEKQYSQIAKFIQEKQAQSAAAPAATATATDEAPAAEPKAKGPATAGGSIPPLIELLKRAKKAGASDFHLSVQAKPFQRLHGELRFLEDLPVVTPEVSKQRLFEILTPAQRQKFEERMDLDTCLEIPGVGRFRTSILQQRRGVAGVFRIIRDKIPTLEELGMPDVLNKFTTYHQGIVLVTGSTGSGKSSTLAALIEIINQQRKDHVITLEDPIEYVYECKKANISQRQIEAHTQSCGIL